MFKLSQSERYAWPVEVKLPIDGGQYATETFDAEFRRVSLDELQKLQDRVLKGQLTDPGMVREVMVGWRGVTDNGVDVPYSQGAMDRLLAIPGTAAGIVEAFIASYNGIARKN